MPPWPCASCESACEVLATAEFTHDGLEAALRAAAVTLGIKAGQMFEPVRVAVCGRKTRRRSSARSKCWAAKPAWRASTQAIEKLKGIYEYV